LQTVTLIATPSQSGPFEPPSTFVGWSGGGCHGTGRCTLTMDGDKSVTATFIPPQRPRCTLRRGTRRGGTLRAVVVCNKRARVRIAGTVTDSVGSSERRFRLRPVTSSNPKNRAMTLTVELPSASVADLNDGHQVAIKLTIRATGAGGTMVTTRRLELHG
jgi:hypothetical protein